jgi:hypothetical protein
LKNQEVAPDHELDDIIYIYKYIIKFLNSNIERLQIFSHKTNFSDSEINSIKSILNNINVLVLCLKDLIALNSPSIEGYFKNKAINNKMKKLKNIFIYVLQEDFDFDSNHNKIFNRTSIEIKINIFNIVTSMLSISNDFFPVNVIDLYLNKLLLRKNTQLETQVKNDLYDVLYLSISDFLIALIKRVNQKDYRETSLHAIFLIIKLTKNIKVKYRCYFTIFEFIKSDDKLLYSIFNKNGYIIDSVLNFIVETLSVRENSFEFYIPSVLILNKFLVDRNIKEQFSEKYSVTEFLINLIKKLEIKDYSRNSSLIKNLLHSLLLSFSSNKIECVDIEMVKLLNQILLKTDCKYSIEDILNIYDMIINDCDDKLYNLLIVESDLIETLFYLIKSEIDYQRTDSFIILLILMLMEALLNKDFEFKFMKKLRKMMMTEDITEIFSNLFMCCNNIRVREKTKFIIKYFEKYII